MKREAPEDDEGEPVLRVMLDDDLFILDMDEMFLARRRIACTHNSPRPAESMPVMPPA